MSEPVGLHEFDPYFQRKLHLELKPADFVRVQGKWYIIDEVRRFRRPFDFTATETRNLIRLTGSLTSRFQHIDKFAVDPSATCQSTQVRLTYRGVDVTGLQYAHVWTMLNASRTCPDELDINSFSREDIVQAVVTYVGDEDGDCTLWFSGEEYTLVEYPSSEDPERPGPPRFVIVHPYGFSRVMTREEFVAGDLESRLRT